MVPDYKNNTLLPNENQLELENKNNNSVYTLKSLISSNRKQSQDNLEVIHLEEDDITEDKEDKKDKEYKCQ